MAIMSIIPGIGTFVVWGPIVAYLLFKGDTVTALALLAWNGAVVGSVDNVLRPMLVGKDTQMPDLLILLSTLGGLSLFGAAGLVIGPVVAGLCITCWAIYGRVFKEWLEAPPIADAATDPQTPAGTPANANDSDPRSHSS
jgi:predicted PurR-regulated permease PerM